MNLTSNTYLFLYIFLALLIYFYFSKKWDKSKKQNKNIETNKKTYSNVQESTENTGALKSSSNDIINEFDNEENPFLEFQDKTNDLSEFELEDDLYTKRIYNNVIPENNLEEPETMSFKDNEKKSADQAYKDLSEDDFIKKISKNLNPN